LELEGENNNLTYWRELVNLDVNWSDMTKSMRKDLINRLGMAFTALLSLNISKEEIETLIKDTDPATVWDALIEIKIRIASGEIRNHYKLLNYLRKLVYQTWRDQHPSRQSPRQPAPPQPVKFKGEPMPWEVVEKYHPLNFRKAHCVKCDRVLRTDNGSGMCRDCQRNVKREY
jgi:hypothetical protein